ncbi:putative divalent metal ion transporter [Martiniozyma asiatica (nom. inval.)]|nr:putative divalent metal ion transporter [Martiniozyma asiatica]
MIEVRKLIRFIGPGLLISCAYIDPGNYSTSTAAGAQYHYTHMVIILLSNIFAIILQCLCIKLGTVTGLDLAQNCQKHLPAWWNITNYVLAELAVIFTDLAEVVGGAIAFNILFNIPLNYGVLLTIVDVLVIIFAYNPDGSIKHVRKFELFVSAFVILTFGCFFLLLTKLEIPTKEVFQGFLPSRVLFKDKNAIYIALGIIGATVMPHSLYLGSNVVRPRLKEFDAKIGHHDPNDFISDYKPSFQAIKYCLNYSYIELILSLCIIAIFINSSILIVSATALFSKPGAEDADLLSIYEMLCLYISKQAGFIFALAMFFSSIAAGVICTMSGMMIAEGSINWTINPLLRRLITRTISIAPCLFMAIGGGREAIAIILNLSQVVLSLILPFVTLPLLLFTMDKKIMQVEVEVDNTTTENESSPLIGKKIIDFSNSIGMNVAGFVTWVTISGLNIYLIIQWLRGEDIKF